jgi:hypothetical protein
LVPRDEGPYRRAIELPTSRLVGIGVVAASVTARSGVSAVTKEFAKTCEIHANNWLTPAVMLLPRA